VSGRAGGPPLVEISELTIIRNRDAILDRLSLNVAPGSLHVIVGPNGAGKSTLVAALLGQIPFGGRIVLNWRGAGTIGYVPQSFPVDPTLPVTVEDFLALTRQRRPVCLGIAASTRRAIAGMLDRVGMTGLARRPLAVLSGGELRRVLLAHALDPEPELLILDEPASGLDVAGSRWFEETLLAMKGEGRITIVMISHDLDQVRRVADRVTLLDRRVLAEGDADQVLASDVVPGWMPARRAGQAPR
jgi:zinc transport system ATP-binding protein